MLIYGYRTKTKTLGQVEYHCSKDGRATVHTAFASAMKLTLYFIPLFPLGTTYEIVCNICGLRLRAVSALANQLKNWDKTGQLQERLYPARIRALTCIKKGSRGRFVMKRACGNCDFDRAYSVRKPTEIGIVRHSWMA
jgi:hypothetical protein